MILSGGMSAITIGQLQQKLRRVEEMPSPLHIPGGIDISPSKKIKITCVIWMLFIGPAFYDFSPTSASIGRYAGFYFTGLGIWLLSLLINGWNKPEKFIRFDDAVYSIGKSSVRMSFAWDNIAAVRVAPLRDKLILLLEVEDVGAVIIKPSPELTHWNEIVARNRKAWGADVSSDVEVFGYGAPQMAATIRRYVEHPEARAELA